MFANFVALTAGMAATVSAFDCSGAYFSFYNRGGNAMSYQRLDPALFPGQESPHLHTFDGGNGLAASMDFADTQSSSCTTARIKPDKSLYWRPTLFWNGNGTGYHKVPEKFTKIYYKFGDAGNVRANVTEFPEDFQMIAGDPFKRSEYGNPGGIKWSCMQENYQRIDTVGFPKGFNSCKEGFATEITFPACWNGKELDPKNPSAHMAYPTNNGKGLEACPQGFQTARFPTIFIEFWFDISQFDGQYDTDSVPWVLSNGDPTGYGFHADFKNGWEKGVLGKATAAEGYCNCGCGCGQKEMETCFGAENVNDDQDSAFKSCSAENSDSSATSPVEKLPGCNPLQSGPADATQASGDGCTGATPAPINSKASSAVSATPSSGAQYTTSEKASSIDASSSKVTSVKVEVEETPLPSLSLSVPNKQNGYVSNGYGDYATPTLAKPSVKPTPTEQSSKYASLPETTSLQVSIGPDGGRLGPIFSDEATNPPSSRLATLTGDFELPATTASPVQPSGGDGECKAPVYVTLTPTVYVTADGVSNTTSCDLGTVYTTVTNTATVTVGAGGSYKHKRHAHLHKY